MFTKNTLETNEEETFREKFTSKELRQIINDLKLKKERY